MAQIHKNIWYAGLGQLVYSLLAFALIPFASRYLGDEGFGIYSLASAIGFFVSLLTDMGMSTLLTREVAKHKRISSALFAAFLGIKSILVFIAVAILLVYLQVGTFDAVILHSILIFSIASILNSFVLNAFSIFRGYEKIHYETIATSVDKFLSVFLGILFLVMGLEIRIFIASFLFAAIVKLIYSFYILYNRFIKLGFSFHLQRSRVLMLGSIPFGLSVLLAVCYNYFDILMLHAMASLQDLGWYSGSYKFLNLTTLIPTVLTTAFLPQLSRNLRNRENLTELFLKGCTFLFIISIPLVPVVLMFANWIVLTVLGEQFYGSIISLKLLVFAAFAQMLNSFFVALYAAVNKQQRIMFFQIAGLIINLVLNFILIPIISYRGAAIATIVTEWSILLMIVFWAWRHIFARSGPWLAFGIKLLRIAGSTAVTLLLLWFMQVWQPYTLVAIGAGMVVYVLCLQLFRVVDFVAASRSVFQLLNSGEKF